MKIIRKATTPNGTPIQFEKWNAEDYMIGAYPIAKATGKYGLVRKGESFRLSIGRFDNLSEAAGLFDELRTGLIHLTDEVIQSHYWNRNKDRYYMGLAETEE